MDVLEHDVSLLSPVVPEIDERAARRTLRSQIARLERELADAFVTAYRMGGLRRPAGVCGDPRLLGLGELERVRDELAERLRAARVTIAERADVQAANRVALERMLLEPARHRFERIALADLGEPGCGVWQVRPRLGLIGMLMGWWQVKLSSGCPLARGHAHGVARSKLGTMRTVLRTGTGAVLVLMIMFIGSFVLWVGTPLLWLWIGAQVEGSTDSLGTALAAAFPGAVVTIVAVASLLAKLSDAYRSNCRARGLDDPGHLVLEMVLVVSAAFTLTGFVVWFVFLSGANPVPLGINL